MGQCDTWDVTSQPRTVTSQCLQFSPREQVRHVTAQYTLPAEPSRLKAAFYIDNRPPVD